MRLFPIAPLLVVAAAQGCAPRDYGRGSVVCVCNATYCDSLPPVRAGETALYSSSKGGLRFRRVAGLRFASSGSAGGGGGALGSTLRVRSSRRHQAVIGWGATVTDSAGINTYALSRAARENLFKSYFSSEGIEYNLLRVPIGGTDCSTHKYTLDNVTGDVHLEAFSLTSEDWDYKIPFVKTARKWAERSVKLIASAWSAPPWMKTNNAYTGFGFLKKDMYQPWADYHIKFLDAYSAEGLHFWAITTGNEPNNALVGPLIKFNSLGWTPFSAREWIGSNLGPALHNSSHSNVKILTLDDQRLNLPWWIALTKTFHRRYTGEHSKRYLTEADDGIYPNYGRRKVMADKKASKYVDGVAVHWYTDYFVPVATLDLTHYFYPDLLLLGTEASNGFNYWDEKVILGSWDRAVSFFDDILDDLRHWFGGWMEWSIVLGLDGGPSWSENFVDSSILVNAEADEFLKQPTFYAIGHFSKFIVPDSQRICSEPSKVNGVRNVAFIRPDGGTVVVFHNNNNKEKSVTVHDELHGYLTVALPPYSFNTLVYW